MSPEEVEIQLNVALQRLRRLVEARSRSRALALARELSNAGWFRWFLGRRD